MIEGKMTSHHTETVIELQTNAGNRSISLSANRPCHVQPPCSNAVSRYRTVNRFHDIMVNERSGHTANFQHITATTDDP